MKSIPKRYILLILSLYISQFIVYGFFMDAFVTILRKNGTGLQYLGLIYMLSLFAVFRFIWAPFIDKIQFSKHGHYKGWLFITQSLVFLTLVAISFCTINFDLLIILALITFFSFVAATQYTALDGFIYKTLSAQQRAVGNATKIAGGMIGLILSSGIGLILYTHFGWQKTILIFATISLFSLALLMFHQEDEKEDNGLENPIRLRDILKYWMNDEKRTWFFLIALSPVAISVFFGLTSRILVDKHWSLDKIGFTVNIIGYSVGVLFSFFVPFLITKFSKKTILYIGLLGQIIGLVFLLFIQNYFSNTIFVSIVVSFTYIFYPFSTTVIATLMMDNIKSKTPAFEYSIQQSLNAFVGMFTVGFSMFLAGFIGYSSVICIGIVLGLVSLVFAKRMKM